MCVDTVTRKFPPTSSDGKPIGAPYLLTVNTEYQYQVLEDWWLAAFADTGLAANKFNVKELRYGAGFWCALGITSGSNKT